MVLAAASVVHGLPLLVDIGLVEPHAAAARADPDTATLIRVGRIVVAGVRSNVQGAHKVDIRREAAALVLHVDVLDWFVNVDLAVSGVIND